MYTIPVGHKREWADHMQNHNSRQMPDLCKNCLETNIQYPCCKWLQKNITEFGNNLPLKLQNTRKQTRTQRGKIYYFYSFLSQSYYHHHILCQSPSHTDNILYIH